MSGAKSYRALVIDHDPAVQDLFKTLLPGLPQTEPGPLTEPRSPESERVSLTDFPTFDVDTAVQGEEGLSLVRCALKEGRPYTMAFVDAGLQGEWNAVETVSRLWKESCDLQIVICTEHQDVSWHEIVRRFGHSGRLLILTKPFDHLEVRQVAYSMAEKWDLTSQARNHLERLQRLVGERTAKLQKANLSLQRRIFQNQQAERRLVTQYAVGRLAGESPSLAELLNGVFQTVGENLDWDWGVIWRWDEKGGLLRLGHQWHRPDRGDQAFEAAIWDMTFAVGSGLPGRAWAEAGTVWTGDLSRATGTEQDAPLSEAGLRCAVALPVWAGTRLYGVMELMSREIRERDADEVQTLSVICGAIGQYVARKQAEEERKTMEIQLRAAQKLESIGQLAAGIAHEINTPTQYIGDNVLFLQSSFSDLNKTHERLEKLLGAVKANTVTAEMVRETEACLRETDVSFLMTEIPHAIQQTLEGVERVSKIVRAMKEFSHPGSEEKTPVDLNRAVETTLTVARNEWKYVAQIKTELDPDLPLVPCMPGEFNQVLLNLVVNAAHAIAEVTTGENGGRGLITASTRRCGDWAEVRIRDTGCGIPEKIRHKIFDPFFTTKPVGKGTGQGLAMAHTAIVDRHQGTLTFETEPGVGTVFIIRLPLNPSASPKREVVSRKTDDYETSFVRR
jgi:signal transduction histidine kinase